MMAEYAVLHQRQVWKIPDSDFPGGSLGLPRLWALSMPAIDLAPFKIGEERIYLRSRELRLIILQLARLQGGTRLTVSEPVEAKRKLALKLGADYVIDPNSQTSKPRR